MDAYKCDRCGILFEQRVHPYISIVKGRIVLDERWLDLCPECQESLKAWLKDKNDKGE